MKLNLLMGASLVLLASCGGGGDNSPESPRPPTSPAPLTIKALDDSFELNKGESTLLNVLENDEIPDRNSVTLSIPEDAELTLEGQSIRYTAPTSDRFTKVFIYTITDNTGGSSQAEVTIKQAVDTTQASIETTIDKAVTSLNQTIVIDVLQNDRSTVGDDLEIVQIGDGQINATIEIIDNKVHYTANENFVGIDNFTYAVKDQSGNAIAGVNVDVLVESKVDGGSRYTEMKLENLKQFPLKNTGVMISHDYKFSASRPQSSVNVKGIGDFNGDDLSDFVACFTRQSYKIENDALINNAGECFITFGNRELTSGNYSQLVENKTSQRIYSDVNNAKLGIVIGKAGDVNGDGFDDLLLQSGENEARSLYLIFGSAEIGKDILVSPTSAGTNQRVVEFRTQHQIINMQPIGDYNNDGLSDFTVSYNVTLDADTKQRHMKIVFGKAMSGQINLDALTRADESFTFINNINDVNPLTEEGFGFGSYTIPLGDINNDNYDDFLVQAVKKFTADTYESGVMVMYGRANGIDSQGYLSTENGLFVVAELGLNAVEVVIGKGDDFNGDGSTDLLIRYKEEVYVYSLNNLTTGKVSLMTEERVLTKIQGTKQATWGGFTFSSLGDINADGFNDFMMHSINNPFLSDNRVHLIYGKAALNKEIDVDKLLLREESKGDIGATIHDIDTMPGTVLGITSSPIGDFNGDGRPDFVIGGKGDTHSDNAQAEVSILFGQPHWGG